MTGSIPVPLSVRIKTARTDSNITNEVTDLVIRNAIPGGFSSATFTLSRKLNVAYDDLQYYANIYVYDSRNGGTVWEGRLEDPGREAGSDGEKWEITAVGTSAHARDRNLPLIYVDQVLDRWHRSRYSTALARTETGEAPDTLTGLGTADDAPDALIVRAEQGVTVSTSWQGDWIYRQILYSGQKISRIRADYVAEGASSNYKACIYARNGNTTSTYNIQQNWVTTPDLIYSNYFTGMPFSTDVVSFRATRNVSSTTADGLATVYFYNIVVRCALMDQYGTLLQGTSVSDYTVNNVDPIQVVADLLGRVLNKYDGPNAVLIGSGVDIYQLAYPDGATPEDVFNDIMTYDPGFYWASWESNKNSGLWRFEYKPWPTTIRYEADTVDGFSAPASAGELYNRVHVRWRDGNDRVKNMIRSQFVQQLSDAGLIREAYIDISNEMGDVNNAVYTGDNFLAEHKYPLNAGTLNIGRTIADNDTGRMVEPWELRSGNLIRVRGILPRRDSLNPTARDGVTVFKVLSVEYNASENVATLELDTFSRTVSRVLADLTGHRYRKN